ncbi:MAG: hypothetical protein ACYS9C_04085 [Planctomycetota bacterium]
MAGHNDHVDEAVHVGKLCAPQSGDGDGAVEIFLQEVFSRGSDLSRIAV